MRVLETTGVRHHRKDQPNQTPVINDYWALKAVLIPISFCQVQTQAKFCHQYITQSLSLWQIDYKVGCQPSLNDFMGREWGGNPQVMVPYELSNWTLWNHRQVISLPCTLGFLIYVIKEKEKRGKEKEIRKKKMMEKNGFEDSTCPKKWWMLFKKSI